MIVQKTSLDYTPTYISNQLCSCCASNVVKYETYCGHRFCEICLDYSADIYGNRICPYTECTNYLETSDFYPIMDYDPSKFRGYIYRLMYRPFIADIERVIDIFDIILDKLKTEYPYLDIEKYSLDSTIPESIDNTILENIVINTMKFYDENYVLFCRNLENDEKFIRALCPLYINTTDELLDYIHIENEQIEQVLYCEHYIHSFPEDKKEKLKLLYNIINEIYYEYRHYMNNLNEFYDNHLNYHIENCTHCYRKKYNYR